VSLPAEVLFGTVIGSHFAAVVDGSDTGTDPDSVALTGQVTFTPDLVDGTGRWNGRLLITTSTPPVMLTVQPVPVELTAGAYSVSLIATDIADALPTAFTWTASFNLSANGAPVSIPPVTFVLPSGTTVDVTLVAPVSTSDGWEAYVSVAASAAAAAASAASAAASAASAAMAGGTMGKNLFDQSAASGPNLFWNGAADTPVTLSGYYASAKIPVVVGTAYTINNARDIAFFKADGTHTATSAYVNNTTSAPYTFTPSGLDAFIGYNVTTANLPLSQMEVGSSVTSYEPYGVYVPHLLVSGAYATDTLAAIETSAASARRAGGGTVYKTGNDMAVRSAFDATRDVIMPVALAGQLAAGGEVMVILRVATSQPFVSLVPSGAADADVWPTIASSVTSTAIHGPSDDNCPINVGWTYIGANHGYNGGSTVTMTAHGKTAADRGSQWSDGTRTYTLLTVIDVDTLLMGNQYTVAAGIVTGSTVVPAASLTHVAGATNTATITITGGVTATELHPVTQTHTVDARIDGKPVLDAVTTGQLLTITETYTTVSFKALIDWSQANIGVDPFANLTSMGSLCRISNTYRFSQAQIVVAQTVNALEAMTLTMGVTQAIPLTVYSGGSKKQFMPGVGTVGGLDFTTLADLSTMTADIDIAPANYTNALAPAQRMIQWVYDGSSVPQYGFAMGVLPTGDGHPTQRVKNAVTKSWFISNSFKKNYPQIVYAKTLAIGATVSGTAFRRYLAPPDTASGTTVVASDGASTWVMHDKIGTTTSAQVPIPELLGRRLRPVGPVALATTSDQVTADGLTYAIATSPGYGLWRGMDDTGKVETIPGATATIGDYFVMDMSAVSALALTGSYQILYLWPMYLSDATPVDRACVEVTVLGTGVLRHGVYDHDRATGKPVLTGPLADFGTVDPTAAAVKESTLSPAVVLPAGWHWYGLVWQTTNTTAPTIRFGGIGALVPFDIGTSSALMSGSRRGYSTTGVTGALGALGTLAAAALPLPRVAYRRA